MGNDIQDLVINNEGKDSEKKLSYVYINIYTYV